MDANTINSKELAESKVIHAIEEITRTTKKTLMDYVIRTHLISFAKVVAYLGAESKEGKSLLSRMDHKTRNTVISFSKNFSKSDKTVIVEIEHILTVSNINFDKNYKTIKQYLLNTTQNFAKRIIKKFRKESPIFQEELNKCIFNFDDILILEDCYIPKIIQNTDPLTLAIALKGTCSELKNKFFRNMDSRKATMLKEDMEWMGPVRLSDVKECRAKILNIIFQLEAKGELFISKVCISDILFD